MAEKGVFGSALIKKQHYLPKGFSEEEMIFHMHRKGVGSMYALPNIIYGKRYLVMDIKDPWYFMPVMTTYGTLEIWRGWTHSRGTRD